MALKAAGLVQTIKGYSQSPASSAKAKALGAIDLQVMQAAEAAKEADLIVIAVPVAATQSTLAAIAPQIGPSTLVVDVGSTKCNVVQAAQAALGVKVAQFVPSHPIAGAEKAGVDHASASLYQGRQVILTPIRETSEQATDQAQMLWEAIGCNVISMDPAAHDAAFAKVSHLPHLLAFAYINSILNAEHAKQSLALAGTGFKDFSRIAGSEPHMWRDVFLANQTEILASLDRFEDELRRLRTAIVQGRDDVLLSELNQASACRSAWRIAGTS
jgi:prephenate dehydrogenase